MFVDKSLTLCDATALDTGGTGKVLVGSQIDLTTARDIGNGEPLYLVISVDTAVTSAGSATVSFELSSDASAAVAVDGTETLHIKTDDIAKATLVAGYQIVVPLPTELPAYERYVGIVQNVGTAALTAGKINAFITPNPQRSKAYANAI